MKRKKGSKERRERKGRGEEGSRGWREGRKEKKGKKRERGASKKSAELWQEQVLFGDRSTVHNFSGVPMQTLKERKTR